MPLKQKKELIRNLRRQQIRKAIQSIPLTTNLSFTRRLLILGFRARWKFPKFKTLRTLLYSHLRCEIQNQLKFLQESRKSFNTSVKTFYLLRTTRSSPRNNWILLITAHFPHWRVIQRYSTIQYVNLQFNLRTEKPGLRLVLDKQRSIQNRLLWPLNATIKRAGYEIVKATDFIG